MKVSTGQWINFIYKNKNLSGQVIKIYKQIGYEYHGHDMVVINTHKAQGLVNSHERFITIPLIELSVI